MDITSFVSEQTGISQDKVSQGLGVIFKMLKSQLEGGEFASLASKIPQVDALIASSDTGSSGSSPLGALGAMASTIGADKLGGMAQVANSLSGFGIGADKLPGMVGAVQKFMNNEGLGSITEKLSGFLGK